jgi:S1-C subfamily serine protease
MKDDLGKIVLVAVVSSFLTVLFMSHGADFSPANPAPVVKFETKEQPAKVITEEKVTHEEKIIRDESAVIRVVKEASPSVVSILVMKNLPKMQSIWPDDVFPFQFQVPSGEMEKKQIGGGTGFVVADGLILTNKHVVSDPDAEYIIVTNDDKRYEAKIAALDPVYDIALLKAKTHLNPLKLGDSSKIEVGQTVIAIGNALGEFRNTVSVGVVSGLKRTIGAELRSLIQTDAAINRGNSGGPLLNLKGEVIGINVAKASGAENIGFAIPINAAKKAVADFKKKGKIVYPFLGIRYNINNHLVLEVVPDSPAAKAGLRAGDVILEFDNQRLTDKNTLADIILKYKPGDRIKIKILRNGQEKVLYVTLSSR